MKFGKTIQARQIPGWGPYYLDYKFLKKIINSLASRRPASEASLLALGIRPSASLPDSTNASTDVASSALESATGTGAEPTLEAVGVPIDLSALSNETDLSGAAGLSINGGATRGRDNERDESFKAHRAVFFFKLGRELEKINAFYLTKERELRLRILTLLTNRKRLLLHLGRSSDTGPNDIDDMGQGMSGGEAVKRGVEWANLEEGWRLFERDLGKLQQYIEINATGFRKILKKWDKRSKSNTKELYLERQVEIQPCFNREYIAKMADIVAANLLDLARGSAHLNTSFLNDLPEALGADGLSFDREVYHDLPESTQTISMDAVSDLEFDLERVLSDQSPGAVREWLRMVRERQQQKQNGDARVMRLIWRAIEALPQEYLETTLSSVDVNFNFIDNINGRNPLHESCISGRLELVEVCLAHGMPVASTDAYGRTPLHYAAMYGHTDIAGRLLQQGADATTVDMDGHTPVIQAIISGNEGCVKILVEEAGTNILEPTAISNDLIPLSLACQHGRYEVAKLLLENGAKILPNSEGLYPQHLAARAGHAEICQLLVDLCGPDGGGKDRHDKYNMWTPLHHACIGGSSRHLACMRVLVQAGCDVNAEDEYGKTPGFYAAWYGQIACLAYLKESGAKLESAKSPKTSTILANLDLGSASNTSPTTQSPNSDGEDEMALDGEVDMIPSLSLPPPIIPLRMYGHDFLAKRNLVQVTLGHPITEAPSEKTIFPVKLYSRTDDDNLLNHWSSLKLVMTSKHDATAMPHSIVLPLADERESFSFHVEDLDTFTLELSLYPTFGSKVIGRAIVLPSTFRKVSDWETLTLPLMDHHLKTIGEVSCHVQCVKPFDGAQLEIGGRVETYWKSTTAAPSAAAAQDHAHQFQPHRPLSISTSSPSMRSVMQASNQKTQTKEPKESGFITASSLSGEYLHLVVQVTTDYQPVIFFDQYLPYPGLTIGISEVALKQYLQLGSQLQKSAQHQLDRMPKTASATEWYQAIRSSLCSLEEVLAALPVNIGLNLEIRYKGKTAAERDGTLRILDMNRVADSILHTVYTSTGATRPDGQKRNRKIIFSSFQTTVCSPVIPPQIKFTDKLDQATPEEESLSVREAVKLAKEQNMLGIVLDRRILTTVPSLVQSVKDAGLVLIAFDFNLPMDVLRKSIGDYAGVDGYMTEGQLALTA
ncbi:hypothetical protein QFC22_003319 [Naganishia vaughanmartiniae]|uniref:Uncharacterized protein n=1 Tax=Naganishia vaughanmartiniae TaxID=1424756 RepID=A0ACC2X894_9TREE|nr:hypothetical protein QFC22_003319 [Naganishia vaughanmartiniae]